MSPPEAEPTAGIVESSDATAACPLLRRLHTCGGAQVMDKHLELLAKSHVETKFVKVPLPPHLCGPPRLLSHATSCCRSDPAVHEEVAAPYTRAV